MSVRKSSLLTVTCHVVTTISNTRLVQKAIDNTCNNIFLFRMELFQHSYDCLDTACLMQTKQKVVFLTVDNE